jgi:Fic family protein
MKRGVTGYQLPIGGGTEGCRAFIPFPLPPKPPLQLSEPLQNRLCRANLALGRLDGLTRILPNPAIFIYSYIRKEAVLSSQIEGTQSSLSDLLLFENKAAPGVPLDDVQEVSNYVTAMNRGIKLMEEGLPVCVRLIKEVHAVLLASGRGSKKEPGEFRQSQNWIGGTRPGNAIFVPPPADQVLDAMGELEKFINDATSETPLLVKAALAHVQFETIHPFLDGNGRIGRLLIALLLCREGALSSPTLYLSLYLKKNRAKYYELLQLVRNEGDWEQWLSFFFEGVEASANQAANTAHRLFELGNRDAKKINALKRAAATALRLHQLLLGSPILSVSMAAFRLNLSFPPVNKAFEHLQALGLVTELTGKTRNRFFAYNECLSILNEETDPL